MKELQAMAMVSISTAKARLSAGTSGSGSGAGASPPLTPPATAAPGRGSSMCSGVQMARTDSAQTSQAPRQPMASLA